MALFQFIIIILYLFNHKVIPFIYTSTVSLYKDDVDDAAVAASSSKAASSASSTSSLYKDTVEV